MGGVFLNCNLLRYLHILKIKTGKSMAVSDESHLKLCRLFGRSLHPKSTAVQWGYLNHLGDNYRDIDKAAIVFDAIVRATDVLHDRNPYPSNVFIEALDAHRDHIQRHVLIKSMTRLDEHIRMIDIQNRLHKILKQRGFLRDNEELSLIDYEQNRHFISKFQGLHHAVDIFDEILVSQKVIEGLRKQEIETLDQLEIFDEWRGSREFEKFIETYDSLRYWMIRAQSMASSSKLTRGMHVR
jgi:hypothetical protein